MSSIAARAVLLPSAALDLPLATTLPSGMPDGLHILEPSSFPSWLWALALAALLWWLWRRRAKAKPAPPEEPPTVEPKADPPAPSGIGAAIERLRQLHRSIGDFRAGCHDLAGTIRGHLDDGPDEPEALTAKELGQRFADPIGPLMSMIAELQWRRKEPTADEFDDICQLAADVLSTTRGERR